jgi:hypothetical protein
LVYRSNRGSAYNGGKGSSNRYYTKILMANPNLPNLVSRIFIPPFVANDIKRCFIFTWHTLVVFSPGICYWVDTEGKTCCCLYKYCLWQEYYISGQQISYSNPDPYSTWLCLGSIAHIPWGESGGNCHVGVSN